MRVKKWSASNEDTLCRNKQTYETCSVEACVCHVLQSSQTRANVDPSNKALRSWLLRSLSKEYGTDWNSVPANSQLLTASKCL